MPRRIPLVAVLIGLALSLGLGPLSTTKAHAAAYCNIYPPARVAIWNYYQELTVTYGAGCEASGTAEAYWGGFFPDGTGYDVGWVRGERLSQTLDLYEFYPLGTVEWRPRGAWDADDQFAAQNKPATTIKLGAVSYVSVKRVGSYHEVTARAYHYSPNVSAIVPSGRRPGQVQFRTPGSSTWRPVSGVTVGADGRVTIRTWSPEPRYYRVSFGEQPTLWNTVSEEVRAR